MKAGMCWASSGPRVKTRRSPNACLQKNKRERRYWVLSSVILWRARPNSSLFCPRDRCAFASYGCSCLSHSYLGGVCLRFPINGYPVIINCECHSKKDWFPTMATPVLISISTLILQQHLWRGLINQTEKTRVRQNHLHKADWLFCMLGHDH